MGLFGILIWTGDDALRCVVLVVVMSRCRMVHGMASPWGRLDAGLGDGDVAYADAIDLLKGSFDKTTIRTSHGVLGRAKAPRSARHLSIQRFLVLRREQPGILLLGRIDSGAGMRVRPLRWTAWVSHAALCGRQDGLRTSGAIDVCFCQRNSRGHKASVDWFQCGCGG
jgi:hypothetical protein